jgi:hypothetical protein
MRPDGCLESIRRASGFRVASSRLSTPNCEHTTLARQVPTAKAKTNHRVCTRSISLSFFLKATNCADPDAAPLPDRVMPKQSFAASLLSTGMHDQTALPALPALLGTSGPLALLAPLPLVPAICTHHRRMVFSHLGHWQGFILRRIDGKIAALDSQGRPSFQLLQHTERGSKPRSSAMPSNLLFLEGTDLRSPPFGSCVGIARNSVVIDRIYALLARKANSIERAVKKAKKGFTCHCLHY